MIVCFGDSIFRAKDMRLVRYGVGGRCTGDDKHWIRVAIQVGAQTEYATQEFPDWQVTLRALRKLKEIMKDVSLDVDDHKIIDMKASEQSGSQEA